LLVDADMRRPRQHRVWEIHNLLGLSNILAGQTQLKKCGSGSIPPGKNVTSRKNSA